MTEPSILITVGLALATLVGAIAQRSTGMGFALLASPFLVLALGPLEGILVTNMCGALSALLNLALVWRDIDWPRAAVLVPMGVVGVIPGAIAVELLPAPPLMISVSVVVVVGLAATMALRGRSLPNSRPLAAAGGLASGFMSVTAGVGGPGVVVYARATNWSHHHFAATAQVQFLVLSLVSLGAKRALPTLALSQWGVLLAALLIGLLLGNHVAPKIEPDTAMRLVMVLAMIGALLALGRGLVVLL